MIFALILGILGAIAVLIWDVESDFQKWNGNLEVIHNKEAWHRAGLLLFPYLGFALYQASFTVQHFHVALAILISGVIPGLMVFFWYWTFFDGLYNKFRGQYWWFNGKAEGKKDDSVLDEFLRDKPDWIEIAIKLNGILITTVLYIFLCQ